MDDDNRPLGPNQEGELVLRGPLYCCGYFDNPEARASAMDADGRFHTGDLAKYDEEWYSYTVDRKKEMLLAKQK